MSNLHKLLHLFIEKYNNDDDDNYCVENIFKIMRHAKC